jgi:hypothetical protein
MEKAYEDFLRDVLITINLNLKELQERKSFAEPEELSHIEAKLLAYKEVLEIIRDAAKEFGIPKEEFGL